MQLHKSSIGEDQGQGPDQPDSGSEFHRACERMQAKLGNDIGKNTTRQKRQRAGQGNGSSFGALPPYFGIRVAPMNPITSKEPVSKGGKDSSADHGQKEPHPVHPVPFRQFKIWAGLSLDEPVAPAFGVRAAVIL